MGRYMIPADHAWRDASTFKRRQEGLATCLQDAGPNDSGHIGSNNQSECQRWQDGMSRRAGTHRRQPRQLHSKQQNKQQT